MRNNESNYKLKIPVNICGNMYIEEFHAIKLTVMYLTFEWAGTNTTISLQLTVYLLQLAGRNSLGMKTCHPLAIRLIHTHELNSSTL